MANKKRETQTKNLVLKYNFNSFIEYNQNISNRKIEKIEYATMGCYGTCPIFELTLIPNKESIFKANNFNFHNNIESYSENGEGNFKTHLKKETFKELSDLLNYIDFENLEDNYSVGWTDDSECILKITYDGGKIKTISDYGMSGTYGLKKVHDYLHKIRFNQNWK
ncbi:DUF6438 domain-containing protein [Flavobacterium sp.]|uniref:DUF6438 domain-containing protein n=1 Tax=Flavobacterium sp. TaxID=239 RepID=UPI0039E2D3DF